VSAVGWISGTEVGANTDIYWSVDSDGSMVRGALWSFKVSNPSQTPRWTGATASASGTGETLSGIDTSPGCLIAAYASGDSVTVTWSGVDTSRDDTLAALGRYSVGYTLSDHTASSISTSHTSSTTGTMLCAVKF